MMLDIGTKPIGQSFNKLVAALDSNKHIGGVCGDMDIDLTLDRSFLAYCQYYEYMISHYIDKCFESLFNNQSVLPGAFSLFRWDSIKGAPVEKFLRGLEHSKLSLFKSNMFLAEDRIMCW